MSEAKLPMGKRFNSHFGYIEMPSEILEVGFFDDHLEVDCVDGIYHVHSRKPIPLKITKVFDKQKRDDEPV